MTDLPLFPLGTVLFPGMPLSLHIFEPRYREMMNYCIQEKKPFGVCLIEKGQEVGSPAQPHLVGCMAQISQVRPLEDGRMNMVAMGSDRFRIDSLDFSQSYLVGNVTSIPIQGDVTAVTEKRSHHLRVVLTEYLDVLSNVWEVQFNLSRLPDDPLELAYLTAALLQAPTYDKQKILELDDVSTLVNHVYDICRREIPLLRQMISPPIQPASEGMFSLN